MASESYRPDTRHTSLGIGLIGCGSIAQGAHLPAYRKYGFVVVGAFDVFPEALQTVRDDFGVTPFTSIDDLLADRRVLVADVAVRTEDRYPVIQKALEAGKHVLSQKPFAPTLDEARSLVALADERGLTIGVNQNGRWAPSWRQATVWREQGAIGEVRHITHDFHTSFAWTVGRHFDAQEHFVLYDYASHWFDITRCWLEGKTVVQVRAWDTRSGAQGANSRTPWNMFAEINCADGTVATLIGTGAAKADTILSHTFELTGSAGSIRGEVLDREWVELDVAGNPARLTPDTQWFPDGFAGAMGELQAAIVEEREPFNSGRHVLATLELALAAVESAEQNGTPREVHIPL